MTKANEAKRAALRAEWETGRGNRDLARRYGVSEGIIRHWVKRENWQRDWKAIEAIHTRAEMLTLAHFADPKSSEGAPAGHGRITHPAAHPTHSTPPSEPTEAQRAGTGDGVGAAGTGERLRELSVEMAARAMAEAQIGQLERAAALARIFDIIAGLIEVALVPVDADADPEGARKQSLALSTLLAGGNSSTLSKIILVWARLAESIQTQERRALGIEDRDRRVATLSGQSVPVQTESAPKPKELDISKLSSAEIDLLMEVSSIMQKADEASRQAAHRLH
ncbi:hypothetical protein EAH89_29385 [Roseomonas nepalensis]|uniref:Helix-turn-helix domain-containing protein n=1 Tax=Muricoccus nepalensis TaxID=1854500 RepID=A0A502EPY1_9PROT|nr:hypothetical protein [Roseomonas nepalensis]TPG38556.1 hypothetical protein EAH89_29385 [Roseomonas nepalensis]